MNALEKCFNYNSMKCLPVQTSLVASTYAKLFISTSCWSLAERCSPCRLHSLTKYLFCAHTYERLVVIPQPPAQKGQWLL